MQQITKAWDFYRGDQIQYLEQEDRAFVLRHPEIRKEEGDAILSRLRVHLNYTKLIINRYLNGVYGLETLRKVADESNHILLEQIWKRNRMRGFMTGVQRVSEIEGTCAVIPRWKEKLKAIKYEKYGAQHIIPISQPDDPTSLHALILSWPAENKWGLIPDVISDTLPGSGGVWKYAWNAVTGRTADLRGVQKYTEIWTEEWVEAYLGKKLLTSIPNPYGVIPFAVFRAEEDDGTFYGQTNIHDVVAVNHIINRMVSDLEEIIRVHGFSLLFVKGDMVDTLIMRPTSFLKMEADKESNSDAKYLTPNSPIGEIQEFVQWLVARMADVSQVPQAAIASSDFPESGFALTIRWLPYTQALAQKRLLYKDAEDDLAIKTLLVQRAHTGQGDPDNCDLSLEFKDRDFLPKPEAEERARNEFALLHNVITPIDLLRERFPDLDEEQLEERFWRNVAFNRQLQERGIESDEALAAAGARKMKARAEAEAQELETEEE